jgi:hypothetical protein
MSKKLYPTDALKQARDLLISWEQIDPGLKLGPLSIESISAKIEAAQALKRRITALEVELTNLRNQRDEYCLAVWDGVKRVRASIKGLYGDDSSEYEIVGGTRRSERKKPRRSPALPAPVEPAQGSN